MQNKDDVPGGRLEALLFGPDGTGDFTLVEEVSTASSPQPAPLACEERARVSLEIQFASPGDAVKAYSETAGVGQFAVLTNEALRKGTEVTVRVQVPGWATPLKAQGKVTWSRVDAMGLALKVLCGADKRRLQSLVMAHRPWMTRMKQQFGQQTAQAMPAKVSSRQTTLVRLEDALLADVVCEVLDENGFIAVADPARGSLPNVLVVDLAMARSVTDTLKRVPVVLVNSSGPNALAHARMPFLRTRAFVPRPATPAQVLQAVRQVFGYR